MRYALALVMPEPLVILNEVKDLARATRRDPSLRSG